MFKTIDISTSALVAQRTNLDTIAGNMANSYVTTDVGAAYRRRIPIFASGNPSNGKDAPGVHIQSIEKDQSPLRKQFEPDHPHAFKDGPNKGYVMMPNVNLSTEMVNAMAAVRAYEANVTVIEISKTMMSASMRLLA
jgi:flagellar basal-body rod protein FlgC